MIQKIESKKQENKRVLMVLTAVSIGGGVQNKIMDIYRKIDKSRVQFDFLIHSTPVNQSFTNEIESLGGNVYFFGRVKDIGVYTYIKRLYFLIKKEKYKVVHSYMGIIDGLILAIARLANVKIRISHVRTITTSSDKRKLLSPFLRYSIKSNSTDLLASSTNAGTSLYKKESFKVIPNALEIDKFLNVNKNEVESLVNEINISSEEIVLGHVGRFSYEKNHEFFLKIAALLKEKSIPFKLILVGDGELREQIEKKIKEMNLESHFFLAGTQPNPEIYYHIFDILLFPSYHEGFGNVAVEAQIAKKYVIASEGVSSETDLGLGLIDYLSIKDPDKWIDQIQSYRSVNKVGVTDQEIRDTLKERLFDIEKSVEKYYSIYKV